MVLLGSGGAYLKTMATLSIPLQPLEATQIDLHSPFYSDQSRSLKEGLRQDRVQIYEWKTGFVGISGTSKGVPMRRSATSK